MTDDKNTLPKLFGVELRLPPNTDQTLLRTDDKYLEHFVFLDELREGGTINMMGAPRELRHEFDLDRTEALEIFQLWTEQFSAAKDPEQYTQREGS